MCFKVEVKGVDGELKKIAESKLTIKPNFAYTLSEVRDDIQRVFDAGYFQQITPAAEDTRDGIKLTLQVLDQVGMDGDCVYYSPPCQDAPHIPCPETLSVCRQPLTL